MTLTLGGASLKQRWRDGNEELKENWGGGGAGRGLSPLLGFRTLHLGFEFKNNSGDESILSSLEPCKLGNGISRFPGVLSTVL